MSGDIPHVRQQARKPAPVDRLLETALQDDLERDRQATADAMGRRKPHGEAPPTDTRRDIVEIR